MTVRAETNPRMQQETMTFRDMLVRVPDAIALAKIETEQSGLAHTPEGKFTLTYLLASRDIMRPALVDMARVDRSLLTPTGGAEYNPQRTIDEIGSLIGFLLARTYRDLPNLWIRTEENGQWRPGSGIDGMFDESDRFAVIDPLDETNAIASGDRFQSTGIAMFDRNGNLLTLGVVSLVDDSMMFYERNGEEGLHTSPPSEQKTEPGTPIRIATLKRRMYALRQLPLFTNGEAVLAQESIGGFSVLSMMNNAVDAMIDPVKGNPWFDYVIWGPAAEKLGFIVTDPDGNPIDTKAIVRRGIEKNPDDDFRIKFVISRTPEVHGKVLNLLRPAPGLSPRVRP